MPRITLSASARAGIALGDTKEVTSIFARPVRDSRLTSSIFCAVGMNFGSIWKPSRTATSWMYRRLPFDGIMRFSVRCSCVSPSAVHVFLRARWRAPAGRGRRRLRKDEGRSDHALRLQLGEGGAVDSDGGQHLRRVLTELRTEPFGRAGRGGELRHHAREVDAMTVRQGV